MHPNQLIQSPFDISFLWLWIFAWFWFLNLIILHILNIFKTLIRFVEFFLWENHPFLLQWRTIHRHELTFPGTFIIKFIILLAYHDVCFCFDLFKEHFQFFWFKLFIVLDFNLLMVIKFNFSFVLFVVADLIFILPFAETILYCFLRLTIFSVLVHLIDFFIVIFFLL